MRHIWSYRYSDLAPLLCRTFLEQKHSHIWWVCMNTHTHTKGGFPKNDIWCWRSPYSSNCSKPTPLNHWRKRVENQAVNRGRISDKIRLCYMSKRYSQRVYISHTDHRVRKTHTFQLAQLYRANWWGKCDFVPKRSCDAFIFGETLVLSSESKKKHRKIYTDMKYFMIRCI